jgi:mannose-6-phosphate isomerase
MYALTNVTRPYAWGSTTAIPDLLGREPSGGPEAEVWLGAHPDSPSIATMPDGSTVPLDELIATDPVAALGAEAAAAFDGKLPFLAKILAAAEPLSLQVHPTLEQAREAFAAEEASGVPRDAGHRNYKDNNHKPEMIVALTDFQALCGFRPAAESRRLFEQLIDLLGSGKVPAVLSDVVQDLSRADESEAIRTAFARLIDAGTDVADATTAAAEAITSAGSATSGNPALATAATLAEKYPGDPGVLLSLLLNHVTLAPGEAIYLPAGNIHAYLQGLGVEVMASSDNVLRGGLTPKHVDAGELMKTVAFQALPVPRLEPVMTELDQQLWQPPFREFQLQRVELAPGAGPVPLAQNGPLLVVVLAGSTVLDSPRGDLRLDRAGSAFVPSRESPVNLHGVSGATETALAFAVTLSGTHPL